MSSREPPEPRPGRPPRRNVPPAPTPFAIWLVPDAATRAALRPLLDAGAARGFGVRFPPHVTVLSGAAPVTADLHAALRCAARATGPVVAAPRGVRLGTTWSRSVYLAVGASPRLTALRRLLRPALGVPSLAPRCPHVSLAYGVPPAERPALAAHLRSLPPPRRLTFDRIALVRPSPPAHDWLDIARWQVLTTRLLTAERP